jgi:hypothetical protein
VTIKLKLKNAEKAWTTQDGEDRSLAALEAYARSEFKIELAKLAFFVKHAKVENDADVTALQHNSVVTVRNIQVAFSSITKLESALSFTGCNKLDIVSEGFPKMEELELDDAHVKHAIDSINYLSGLVDIPEGCESTRRLYIDPILCAAGLKVGDIKMRVEKTIESPYLTGDIDYVFTFNDVVICVTEGKKDNLDAGIAQNIAQCCALRSTRKRKHDEISSCSYYGIATTFIEWVFIEFGDEQICRSNMTVVDPTKPESIRDIIGQVVGLLKVCKEDAVSKDENSKASRAC